MIHYINEGYGILAKHSVAGVLVLTSSNSMPKASWIFEYGIACLPHSRDNDRSAAIRILSWQYVTLTSRSFITSGLATLLSPFTSPDTKAMKKLYKGAVFGSSSNFFTAGMLAKSQVYTPGRSTNPRIASAAWGIAAASPAASDSWEQQSAGISI